MFKKKAMAVLSVVIVGIMLFGCFSVSAVAAEEKFSDLANWQR